MSGIVRLLASPAGCEASLFFLGLAARLGHPRPASPAAAPEWVVPVTRSRPQLGRDNVGRGLCLGAR
jgi:hypothetical protein